MKPLTTLPLRPVAVPSLARQEDETAQSSGQHVRTQSANSSSHRTGSNPLRALFLAQDHNSEVNHRDALAAAQLEHTLVRRAAIKVIELYELQEKQRRVATEQQHEGRRLHAEAALAAEESRLEALRQQQIQKGLPPVPPTAPQQLVQPAPAGTRDPDPLGAARPSNGLVHSKIENLLQGPTKPFNSTASNQTNGSLSKPPSFSKSPHPPTSASNLKPLTNFAVGGPSSKPVTNDRYLDIHRRLKTLRKNIEEQAKVPGSPLKLKLGHMRREIRKSIGQLTGGKGANSQLLVRICGLLKEALEGRVPSQAVDVAAFIAKPRVPVEDGNLNDPNLPSLFVYLIHIFAKAAVNQFINECGANPQAAEPIGITVASVFSHKEFQWRGASLIDILLAKYRVVCPVLFGVRGNETTERGRLSIGWRRDGTGWVSEQTHHDRMTGLGAGFAAIALRDFSKAARTNPYPPYHYWTAMAVMVNTPAGETSNTQYIVLKAMIDGSEQRFLLFYGSAGLAALRFALVEFPRKAPAKGSAAAALLVLGELLRKDGGLDIG